VFSFIHQNKEDSMKKTIFMAIAAILITGLLAVPSIAKGEKFTEGEKGPSGQAGKSNIGHLYLYEKDPVDWTIVEGGPWGKMKYNLSGPTFDFVFNGHGLPIGQSYTLIYYPDPWPGTGLVCLGAGTVSGDDVDNGGGGNIHIQGSYETGNLPIVGDENDGAKIWLVPTDDVNCETQEMTAWNPTAILFEGALINYEKTEAMDVD
jgi:hypothetical protein